MRLKHSCHKVTLKNAWEHCGRKLNGKALRDVQEEQKTANDSSLIFLCGNEVSRAMTGEQSPDPQLDQLDEICGVTLGIELATVQPR